VPWAANYGSAADPDKLPVLMLGEPGPESRRRVSGLAMLQAVALPCALCTGTMVLLSFPVGFQHEALANFLIILGLVFVGVLAWKAVYGYLVSEQYGTQEPTWFMFLAVTCLLGLIVGLVVGKAAYSSSLKPYSVLSVMGSARDVDPADVPGAKYLDVSRISFQSGSRVAEELSLGYKDSDVYCVAPIVSNSTQKPSTYDFWAVGINCCSPMPPARFWCSRYDITDPYAHSGQRFMDDAVSSKFRLAIEQAEEEYRYSAGTPPMLFTWTKDAVADVEFLRKRGLALVWTVAVAHLIAQAACVLCVLSAVTGLDGGALAALRQLTRKEAPPPPAEEMSAHGGAHGCMAGPAFSGVGMRFGPRGA